MKIILGDGTEYQDFEMSKELIKEKRSFTLTEVASTENTSNELKKVIAENGQAYVMGKISAGMCLRLFIGSLIFAFISFACADGASRSTEGFFVVLFFVSVVAAIASFVCFIRLKSGDCIIHINSVKNKIDVIYK